MRKTLVESNWIDNPKIRKELYDFNQAVKQVYELYRYSDGIVTPITLNAVKNKQLFTNSVFFRTASHFDFINNCAVNPVELNNALKDKCYNMNFNEDTWKFSLGKYQVSVLMHPDQISDMRKFPGLVSFTNFMDNDIVAMYSLTDEDINRLLNYDVMTLTVGSYKGRDIKLIVTKELFPVIKKVHTITMTFYPNKELEDVFNFTVKSCADTWSFSSQHHMINI